MAGRRRSGSAEHAEQAAVEETALPWAAASTSRPIAAPEDPPGRPWSVSAAREPVHPLAPQPAPARSALARPAGLASAGQPSAAAPSVAPPSAYSTPAAEPPTGLGAEAPAGATATELPEDASAGPTWTLTAVVAVALVVALALLVTSRLHLGSTAAPALGINGLAAIRGNDVPANFPEGHFPTTATQVDVGCDYVGASPGQVINFVITLQPASRGSGVVTLPTQSHTFSAADGQTGHIVVSIAPQSRGFISGTYTVDARHEGRSLRSTEFTVESAQPQPSPSPVGI